MHLPTPERKSEIYDTIRTGLVNSGIVHPEANPHYVLEAISTVFKSHTHWQDRFKTLSTLIDVFFSLGEWECKNISPENKQKLFDDIKKNAQL